MSGAVDRSPGGDQPHDADVISAAGSFDGTPGDLPRTIGFFGASAIMVGIIVGSGIFRTPAAIASELGSPAVILILWVAGGVLSLFGALTYAELGAMFPQSGGIYVFLREGYGRCIAFVFGWTYMLITKPLAAAGIAIVLAEHINALLGTHWDARVITCVVLTVLTAINTVRVSLGAGLAVLLTGFKLLALVAIVVLGLILMKGSAANLAATESPHSVFAALAPVMALILWTYDGWSDIAAISGEVRRPQKMLPRIFLTGTAVTIALYVAVNAVYMWMVPLPELRGLPTLAPVVVERLIGSAGGVAVTLLIVVSTLGSTHGSIITGARVTFAQARDGLLFSVLGRIHPVYETPAFALWSQLVLSCAAVWYCEKFERLAGGFIFTMWIFYAMAALSVIILRKRRPEAVRPYRCWGYPAVPIAFVLSAIVMTVLSIRESPSETLPWLGVLAAGVPAYFIWGRFKAAAKQG